MKALEDPKVPEKNKLVIFKLIYEREWLLDDNFDANKIQPIITTIFNKNPDPNNQEILLLIISKINPNQNISTTLLNKWDRLHRTSVNQLIKLNLINPRLWLLAISRHIITLESLMNLLKNERFLHVINSAFNHSNTQLSQNMETLEYDIGDVNLLRNGFYEKDDISEFYDLTEVLQKIGHMIITSNWITDNVKAKILGFILKLTKDYSINLSRYSRIADNIEKEYKSNMILSSRFYALMREYGEDELVNYYQHFLRILNNYSKENKGNIAKVRNFVFVLFSSNYDNYRIPINKNKIYEINTTTLPSDNIENIDLIKLSQFNGSNTYFDLPNILNEIRNNPALYTKDWIISGIILTRRRDLNSMTDRLQKLLAPESKLWKQESNAEFIQELLISLYLSWELSTNREGKANSIIPLLKSNINKLEENSRFREIFEKLN